MRPPTPADRGASLPGIPVVPSSSRLDSARAVPPTASLLAAPGAAEALARVPDGPPHLSDAGLGGGGCFVRPLPIDTTCAAAARRYFREATSALSLPSGLLHDGVTMASELAANTLHAQRNAGSGRRQAFLSYGSTCAAPAGPGNSSARYSTPSAAGTLEPCRG